MNKHEFMPPQGCDLAAPGDKLYSSATRKTYRPCVARLCNPFFKSKFGYKKTPLTVISRPDRSLESSSDCRLMVRMLNYLTGVPWKLGTGTSFLPFIGRKTGVSRNLLVVSKVHFQILFI